MVKKGKKVEEIMNNWLCTPLAGNTDLLIKKGCNNHAALREGH
jgi:hypothetical protein